MDVTMDMLIEHLGNAIVEMPRSKNATMSWAALIANDGVAPIEPDTLYCGAEDEALAFALDNPHTCVLALRKASRPSKAEAKGPASESARSSYPLHLIVVESDLSLAAVYEDLRTFLLRFDQWDKRMRDVLLNRGGYQDFLDASAGMFKDFISITDSSFRLVAYTKDTPIEDPVACHLVKNGFHAQKTIDQFKRYGAIKRWQRQTGILRVNDTHIVSDPTLSYVFRMQGSYFVHVVLQCTESEDITQALEDTFQLLINYLELYVRYDWSTHYRFNKDYASLLRDLVMGRPQSDELLQSRLNQLGIAYEAPYRLCVAESTLGKDGDDQHMLGYHARRLSETMPLDKVGIYQGRLLALVNERNHGTNRESDNKLFEKLCQFQSTFDGAVGISDPFDCVTDMALAYRQARIAIEYGTSGARSLPERFESHFRAHDVHRFSSHFAAYIYEHGKTDVPLSEYCVRKSALARIDAFDKEHGTNDLKLLYVYLSNERRANEAAAELGMPRNTLVYRIAKLQERFDLDLADRKERERLLLLYRLMPA